MAEWRSIPGYSRYSVSSEGDVRRDVWIYRRAPGPVTISVGNRGYIRASLTDDRGNHKTVYVHQLVAAAFIGPKPFAGAHVCHGDGDQLNNRLENLRYDTARGNSRDTVLQGRRPRGSQHVLAKLSEEDVARIRELLSSRRMTQAQIAKQFGVSQRAVFDIASGDTWTHVGGEVRGRYRVGGNRKLTEEHVHEIRSRRSSGESLKALANAYSVSVSNICVITRGRSWRHHKASMARAA